MKAVLILAAVLLSACSASEQSAHAVGAGVTEPVSVPAMALAGPAVTAAGAGSESAAAPAAAIAKGKRQ